MFVRAKIQKWGNGLALRVSGPMRDIPNFHEGSDVSIEISEGGLIIKKIDSLQQRVKFPFTEAELLKKMDPITGHADAITNPLANETGD